APAPAGRAAISAIAISAVGHCYRDADSRAVSCQKTFVERLVRGSLAEVGGRSLSSLLSLSFRFSLRSSFSLGHSIAEIPRGAVVFRWPHGAPPPSRQKEGLGWNLSRGFSVCSASRTCKTHPMSDETPNPSTGPKAGHEGEQKPTDEERLLDEIAKQKELIDAPPGDSCEAIAHRVSLEKRLGQLEFKYQFLVEKKRLACELLKFQELYGDLYSEPCLICLDDIYVHASEKLTETFNCCGGFICKSCARNVRESEVGVDKCPLCREVINDKTEAENAADLMALAKEGPANLGYALANLELAKVCLSGTHGFEMDNEEACFRASVAFALDNTSEESAAGLLGILHYINDISEPSPYLACHYLNIWASEDSTGMASYFYSKSLLRLAKQLHDGILGNGFNATPAIFFWMKNSCDMGYGDARELLKQWETIGQSYCANCAKESEPGEKFKQCSKCRAQWYCSKECQVEAWRAGHKQDCKRATILKFEDYLHAETKTAREIRTSQIAKTKHPQLFPLPGEPPLTGGGATVFPPTAPPLHMIAPMSYATCLYLAWRSLSFDKLWNPSGAYRDDCSTAAALDRPPRAATGVAGPSAPGAVRAREDVKEQGRRELAKVAEPRSTSFPNSQVRRISKSENREPSYSQRQRR
ncbi:hypothetical protein THAOC_17319, partial [Thalassiosira oceanica]